MGRNFLCKPSAGGGVTRRDHENHTCFPGGGDGSGDYSTGAALSSVGRARLDDCRCGGGGVDRRAQWRSLGGRGDRGCGGGGGRGSGDRQQPIRAGRVSTSFPRDAGAGGGGESGAGRGGESCAAARGVCGFVSAAGGGFATGGGDQPSPARASSPSQPVSPALRSFSLGRV